VINYAKNVFRNVVLIFSTIILGLLFVVAYDYFKYRDTAA